MTVVYVFKDSLDSAHIVDAVGDQVHRSQTSLLLLEGKV